MNVSLLKKLLPGEYEEFLVKNLVRDDGRELRDHRLVQITRSVMGSNKGLEAEKKEEASEKKQEVFTSCAVKLG